MSILVEDRWKIHIRLVRLGLVKGFTMSKQTISIFLVLLLLVPLINTASADEVEGPRKTESEKMQDELEPIYEE